MRLNPITLDTFIASDHHFGHKNIAQYEPSRDIWKSLGFSSMEDMIIQKHNDRVSPEDTVLFLGDFSWDNPQNWIGKLNGKKYLILGNHDRPSDVSYKGFEHIFRGLYVDHGGLLFKSSSIDPLLSALIMPLGESLVCFSHYSVGYEDIYDHRKANTIQARKDITSELFDSLRGFCAGKVIHGHLHSHQAPDSKGIVYGNVCLECTDFSPVRLQEVISKLDAKLFA